MIRNKTVGRNDPCPCGSGRKYKRCCLAEDERRAAEEREQAPQLAEDAPLPAGPPDIQQIPAMLQALARKASSKADRADFEGLLAKTQPILDYMQREPAIEAASREIEPRRAELEKLVKDQKAYGERTRALFAEERFVPLRFTADEVEQAFEEVGRPMPGCSDDKFVETVRKAILHLANKERRNQWAMSLLMHLPDYVAADRPLDGCILQHCAYLTQEERDESNPFLFQMFSYGYDGWVAQQRTREAAMLSELGMDLPRLEGMSMEEIDAWLQEQQADPAKVARMEKVLLANPQERSQVEAALEQMERDAHQLLEREDAAHLLLPPVEVQPWLPQLNECWARAREQVPEVGGPAPSPAVGKALFDAIFPLVGEMIADLFTPERIRQLTAQLKDYRNARFAAGDKRAATLANGAIVSLRDEQDPASSRFLYAVGFFSLMEALEVMANPAEE